MCNDAGQREIVPMPFNPIYDLLEREYQVCGSRWEAFAESWTAENWLSNGLRNSADRTSTVVLPWGIFEDSATYKGKGVGTVDSLETGYINALSMKRRHIVYALPKSRFCGEECGCPCRGRCTKNAIDNVVLFFAKHAATGIRPERRHDNLPFEAGLHRDRRGQSIVEGKHVCFACLEYRADWVWLNARFGFPLHNQKKSVGNALLLGKTHTISRRHRWSRSARMKHMSQSALVFNFLCSWLQQTWSEYGPCLSQIGVKRGVMGTF